MRALPLLLLVLVVPTATAWSVEVRAPAAATEATPFALEVCAHAEGRGQVRVLAANATLDVREDRYLEPFSGSACRAFVATPEGGTVEVEARVRAEGGSSVKARAFAAVEVRRAPGELVLVEARAPPLAGVVVRNVGDEPAPLALRALDGARLPDATLAPGESAFLGPRAPPDAERHVPFEPRVRNATMTLAVGARVESALAVPKLRPGHSTLGMYGRTNESASFHPLDGPLLAYATPGAVPLPALVDEAREEVLVASHTFTSADLASALVRALDRGARVRVLLEGAPPGGVPAEERALVATLQARGAEVLLMGGEGARYRTMHAKLVVIDRASVAVGTENFGSGGSRGFGLIVRDAALARRVAEVMDADAAPWHDIAPARFADAPALVAPSLEAAPPARVLGGPHEAALVLSPDDPRALAAAVASARASVDVAMLRAESASPMVSALVEAARAGARVRLLLDGRFDDGANRETVARLAALAEREDLPLEARLDAPERTLHAKMFVVDNATSYVGSMNWVRAAWADNREAGLLVRGEALAAWLTHEFEKDWEKKEVGPPAAQVPAPGWLWVVALALTRGRRGCRRGPGRARA